MSTWAADTSPDRLSLQAALTQAYAHNPDLAASLAKVDAERSAVRSQSFLDDPQIGFMHENNLNFMELAQGPMNLLSISQQIKFPAKYFAQSRAQSARASQAEQEAHQKRLEVRSRVVSAYFGLFAVDRVLSLLAAQRESLREIARTAESRYSTGSVPQQDEMKAHVEQTQLEKDILMVEEERATAQAMLNAVLGQVDDQKLQFGSEDLQIPSVTADLASLPSMIEHHSRHIQEARAALEESDANKTLASLSYAPDFTLSYRRAIGSYSNQNAYAASIEMTIPLWFFARQSGEVGSTSARAIEAERKLQSTTLEHVAEVRSLTSKVQSNRKILDIYKTGLIPQAESTLSSSRASYRAGRSNFIELLDSERSLYGVRIAFYRSLAEYTEQIGKLEEILGESISTLPFGESP